MRRTKAPDPVELAASLRGESAWTFSDHVAKHFEAHQPSFMAIAGRHVRYYLARSFDDAKSLDAGAAVALVAPDFLSNFLRSVFCEERFFEALAERARLPEDQKSMRLIRLAERQPERRKAAEILWLYREKLKDGWPVNMALAAHAPEIGECLSVDGEWLLARLAETSRKVPRPSRAKWILRAWLPLALWRSEAEWIVSERIQNAWRVASSLGFVMPSLPEAKLEGDAYPVTSLIRDARKVLEKGARRRN